MNISSENELGNSNISTENIKAITGGDRVEIERKNQDSFSAELYTRLIVSVNNDFTFTDMSHGILRRLMFIPFNVRFYERPLDEDKLVEGRPYQDPGLEKVLLNEISGIFNLAYEGLKRLLANDYIYTSSQVCDAELDRYINYLNPITAFIKEELVIDTEEQIKRTDINEIFDQWQKDNAGDYKRITSNRAASKVKDWLEEENHHVRDKKVRGVRHLEGIREMRVEDREDHLREELKKNFKVM